MRGEKRESARARVVYWYCFSNPRTKCIHCGNSLVMRRIQKSRFPTADLLRDALLERHAVAEQHLEKHGERL